MAERVARVKVQATADLKGLEDAKKALQDLQKAVGPTDAALAQVRQEILDFANANKRTEAVIQAQVNAFQKLRQQAEVGGQVYNELGQDIERLKRVAAESTTAISKLGQATANAGRQQGGKSFWQQQSESLVAFNRQAGQTGKAVSELAAAFDIKFERAGNALQEASRELSKLKQNASNIGSLFQGPQKGGGLFEVPRKGLADIQAFSQLVTRLKEQTETATGRVGRLTEGLFAAGVAGKGISATVASLGGVAGAAENVAKFAANLSASFAQMGAGAPQWAGGMKTALNQISLLLNEPANGVAGWVNSLNSAQAKLTALNVPLEAFNNALAAIGPEGAAVAGVLAVSFAGLQDAITRAFRAGDKEASEALQSITDETQRLINKLAQLSEAFRGAASMNELQALRAGGAARFNETPAGTDASRRAANTIASAEARIKAEGMAQAEVLEAARQRYRGTTESVDALSERLAYLQQAMKYVDQSTAEGKAEFAAFSNEANKVKGQIDQLSNSYRTVADAIRDAARAQGEYANQSTVNNYLNRAATRQQEELVAAARAALSQPQVPLLPAGDTSKPAIRGGARLLSNYEVAGTSEQIGAAMSSQTEAMTRALNTAEKEVEDLKRSFQELIQPIEKVAKSEFFSPNSINALKARREQIDRERSSVDMLSKDYQRLSGELAKVDRQLERTQSGGMRGKIGYIGQGIGAAASAGIFGGPEGAIGGLLGGGIGAIAGGPAGFAAGSFIGSSGGAYAGMARQQLGQFTTYAADIGKLEIALKGVTKTQEEYQRALAASASVTRDFNVPQLEATKGMTQLSAAVIGAGGKVADAEVVFRNVTSAIKASGGTSEDVQGALTALGQIFSKGKVSAEELQGQLGERLPGAVTMFAKATGRTLPQLQKDLEQGVVGLADLMKFVVSKDGLGQFEQRAMNVAKSSEEAGARLTTTWNDTKRAIGEALLPLGAQIQDSLANALRDATPALVEFAKSAGAAIKVLVDNAGLIGGVLKILLGFAAVAGAAIGVTKLAGAIGSVGLAVKSLGGAMSVATLAARTLGIAIAAIPGIGWIAAGVTALGLLTVELYNNNGAFRTWANNLATVISSDFKSAWDKAVSIASKATKDIGDLLNGLSNISSSVGSAISSKIENAFGGIIKKVREFWNNLPEPIREAMSRGAGAAVGGLISPGNPVGGYIAGAAIRAGQMGPDAQDSGMFGRYGVAGGKTDKLSSGGLTDWKIEQQQKEDAAKKAAETALREAERLAAEQQRLDEQLARNEIRLDDERFRHRQELIRREFEYQQELAQRQNELWANNFVGLGAQSARAVANLFAKLDSYRKTQFDSQAGIASAQQDLRSSRALEGVTSQGLPGGGVGGGGLGKLSSQGQALVAAAQKLGVSPLDLATIIGFETGGTYSPSKRGGAGGNYMGLIQFGPNERKAYGANPRQSFEEQVTGPVVRYFKDRFKGAGMSTQGADLLTLYRTVLGGNPKASLSRRDAFGTSPQSGVAQMAPHRAEALRRFFGGNVANIPSGATGVASQVRRDAAAEGQVAISQAQLQQQQKLAEFEKKRADALKSFDYAEFNQELTRGLVEQNQALQINVDEFKLKSRLEAEGIRPELIEAEMTKNRLYREQEQLLEPLREALTVVDNPETKTKIVDAIANINNLYGDQIGLVEQLAQAQTAQGAALAAYVGQLKLQLSELTNIENVLITIGQTVETQISSAMSSAVTSVVTGSGSVKQALSELFSSIGQSFVKMATDIIAKQLVMITLQTVLKALGLGFSGGFGGFSGGGPVSGASVFGGGQAAFNPAAFTGGFSFAKGGVMTSSGPIPLKKYARGGIANSPQMALFGEGSTPEAFVPLPDGRRIPVSLKSQDKMNEIMGRSPVQQQSPTLNMTFQTTNIGGVEYVSRDQLEAAMAETRKAASRDGAKRGMSMTLDRLQQSPTTRRQVGLR